MNGQLLHGKLVLGTFTLCKKLVNPTCSTKQTKKLCNGNIYWSEDAVRCYKLILLDSYTLCIYLAVFRVEASGFAGIRLGFTRIHICELPRDKEIEPMDEEAAALDEERRIINDEQDGEELEMEYEEQASGENDTGWQ